MTFKPESTLAGLHLSPEVYARLAVRIAALRLAQELHSGVNPIGLVQNAEQYVPFLAKGLDR